MYVSVRNARDSRRWWVELERGAATEVELSEMEVEEGNGEGPDGAAGLAVWVPNERLIALVLLWDRSAAVGRSSLRQLPGRPPRIGFLPSSSASHVSVTGQGI